MKVNEGLFRELGAFVLIGLAVGAVVTLVGCSSGTVAPAASAPSPEPVLSSADIQPSAGLSKKRESTESFSQIPEQRPGLGTGWGKEIGSSLAITTFDRESNRPHGEVSTIYYNDRAGIEAMAGPWKNKTSSWQGAANGVVEWGVKSGWGKPDHYMAGGKRFVVGKKGRSYSLEVRSLTNARLEVVLSVDGLDVMDGKSASFKKRGYIIGPYERVEVEGFRSGYDKVAAFEFSTVASSYTNLKHGKSRDVGVLGLAVFTEKGRAPVKSNEYAQRAEARPFAEAPMQTAR